MAFITAKNVPLYFGKTINADTMPNEQDNNNFMVLATQVQLNYTPNVAVQRVVGKNPTKDSFALVGPPNATLSFSSYIGPTDEFVPSAYTGDFDIGTTFKIGNDGNGISGSGAYMTSYSLTVTPYAPVLYQADFAIYQPLATGTNTNGFISATTETHPLQQDAFDFNDFGHGAYSTFNDSVLDNVSIVESVGYQYQAQRLPSYNIGGFLMNAGNGAGAKLISAEHSFSIAGDNIQKIVSVTGANTSQALTLNIKNSTPASLLSITVDGRINAENVTVSAADVARGSMTITEPLV